MKYNQLFKDTIYKISLQVIELYKDKEFQNQYEEELNTKATLIKVVIDNYDKFYKTLNQGTNGLIDQAGNRIELNPDLLLDAAFRNNGIFLIESMFEYFREKYLIPQEKIEQNEIDSNYVNEHFEEGDKLVFLELLFVDAQLQHTYYLSLVKEYMHDESKKEDMIDASHNVVYYHHALFLRCIWCEQFDIETLDYDTKKVRVKDAIQKIEAFMLEEEFKQCPDELLKDFDFIKKWLETHSKSLEGIDKETYNQKVQEANKEKAAKAKKQRPINTIDYKEKYPDGFTLKDWKEGKILFFDLAMTQGVLKYDDLKEIRIAQKVKYWEEVKSRLERRKTSFKNQLERSEAKERLINNTIEYYDWYFDTDQSRQNELHNYFLENTPITFLNKTSTKGDIRQSRDFFVNYIVNGVQRNLDSVTNAQPPLERMKTYLGGVHIESLLDSDVVYRFYLWLKNDFNNSNQDVSKPKKQISKSGIEDNIQTALSYISFMKNYNHAKEKIMNSKDYDRLVKYTTYLIEHEAIPPEIEEIPQIKISNQYIRYTFYLIHKTLYTTKVKRKYFIDFLHNVFSQFQNTAWTTTNTKFSVKPNQYEKDTIET